MSLSPFHFLSLVSLREDGQVHQLLDIKKIDEIRKNLYVDSIITTEEALELFRFYHSHIPKICETFDLPITTQLLAHTLLSKYSIKHSVLVHDMKHVMLTCCYFAAKLDNVRLLFADFCGKIKNVNPQTIELIEFILLEMLDFQPWVLTAYPYALGLALKKEMLNEIDQEILEKHLTKIYKTDIPLMFDEVHIAAFVFTKIYSSDLFKQQILDLNVQTELLESFSEVKEIDKDRLKDIDRRILQHRKNIAKNQ